MATRDVARARPDVTPAEDMSRSASGSDRSSEHLLGRVAQQDEAAFESLYDRTADLVARVCRSVLRDLDQVEELIQEVSQEVFLEVWRRAPQFDPARGGARAWVATMAFRRSVDHARSARAARTRELKTAATQLERDYDHVSEWVTTRLDIERVRIPCICSAQGSRTPSSWFTTTDTPSLRQLPFSEYPWARSKLVSGTE